MAQLVLGATGATLLGRLLVLRLLLHHMLQEHLLVQVAGDVGFVRQFILTGLGLQV